MALGTTEFAADLDEMIADIPCTIVWTPSGGTAQTVTGTRTGVRISDTGGDAGTLVENDLRAYAKKASFTGSVTPAPGDLVTVDSTVYRVADRMLDGDGVGVVLQLRRQ